MKRQKVKCNAWDLKSKVRVLNVSKNFSIKQALSKRFVTVGNRWFE